MKGKKLRGRPTKAKKRKRKDSEEEDEENVTEPGDLKDEKWNIFILHFWLHTCYYNYRVPTKFNHSVLPMGAL